MKLKGIYTVLFMMIFWIFDFCDSRCEEYTIVFEEISLGKVYLLKPMKMEDIYWRNKSCILELECLGNQFSCINKIKPKNHATHSFKPDNKIVGPPKTKKQKPIINIDEREKPKHIEREEVDESIYDVTLIYLNDIDMQNSSEYFKKPQNQSAVIQCHYAETSCNNKKYVDNNITRHNNSEETLSITFNRDQNSTIQPIFTGFKTKVDTSFNELKTVTLQCKLLEDQNCTQDIDNKSITVVNMYVKANYIQNGTRTKYFNCTNDYNEYNNSISLQCDAKEFSKHNPDIVYAPHVNDSKTSNETEIKSEVHLMEPEYLQRWYCRIELNDTSSAEHETNDCNIIYFKNCSSNISSNINDKSGEHSGNLPRDYKDRIIGNLTTKDSIKLNTINKSSLDRINKDVFSSIIDKNVIRLHIIENKTLCNQNLSLSIYKGKIIDLEPNNNTKMLLKNNTVELKLSNCLNNTFLITNNTNTYEETELDIILKTGSLNNSNFKTLSSILKEEPLKHRTILQCDFITSTEKNDTLLECKSIDLDVFKNIEELDDIINTTPNASDTKLQKKDKNNSLHENNNKTITNSEIKENSKCNLNETTVLNERKNNNTSKDNITNIFKSDDTHKDTVNKNKYTPNIFTFNRRKDLEEGLGQNVAALNADNTEMILLIVVPSVACASILLVIAFRKYFKKEEYGVALSREPPNEEDTPL